VDNADPVPPPPASTPLPQRRPDAGPLLTLVNGVLAGAGGVYVSTRSVVIVIIAGVMAIVVAALMQIFQR
jgi:hypothetical protein